MLYHQHSVLAFVFSFNHAHDTIDRLIHFTFIIIIIIIIFFIYIYLYLYVYLIMNLSHCVANRSPKNDHLIYITLGSFYLIKLII